MIACNRVIIHIVTPLRPQQTHAGTSFGKDYVNLAFMSRLRDAKEPHTWLEALSCKHCKATMHQKMD